MTTHIRLVWSIIVLRGVSVESLAVSVSISVVLGVSIGGAS